MKHIFRANLWNIINITSIFLIFFSQNKNLTFYLWKNKKEMNCIHLLTYVILIVKLTLSFSWTREVCLWSKDFPIGKCLFVLLILIEVGAEVLHELFGLWRGHNHSTLYSCLGHPWHNRDKIQDKFCFWMIDYHQVRIDTVATLSSISMLISFFMSFSMRL